MYALKIDGAINFAPISLLVKLAPEPTAVIKFPPIKFNCHISSCFIVVPTPGVNT